MHELHNSSPLFFLPILYERYIPTDSFEERALSQSVLVITLVTIVWNIMHYRSSVVRSLSH